MLWERLRAKMFGGVRVAGRGTRNKGDNRGEVAVDLSAEALAMMCPTLFLRPLKKAAHLKKT